MTKQVDPPLKALIVGLDLSPMDTILIAYIHQLSRLKKFERIYFFHVSKELELPEKLLESYPDLLAPLDESIERDIQIKVEDYDWGSSKVAVDVLEGSSIKETLHYADIKEADLIVMGRKKSLKGSGVSASRIARKSNCSVLFVPELLPESLSKILLPIDFGITSERSYCVAEQFMSRKATNLSLIHLYHVPHGYSKTGRGYEQFDTIMLQHAEKEYQAFTENLKMTKIPDIHFVNGDKEDHEDIIMSYAEEINADLIVIGSKGKSTSAFILLGSMAEKLLLKNDHIPLLIVKRKNENMSLLDALRSI